MYLTFDCDYEKGYTSKLLDILKKHDVKTLFFVTKHFVQSQPELCKRMKEEGHYSNTCWKKDKKEHVENKMVSLIPKMVDKW
ncbi:MAG: polysaccharide deacetylase family protein [Eubacterium sp.]|nr:polysaccharide deacetylase family protein [Eubacterium sp.]